MGCLRKSTPTSGDGSLSRTYSFSWALSLTPHHRALSKLDQTYKKIIYHRLEIPVFLKVNTYTHTSLSALHFEVITHVMTVGNS